MKRLGIIVACACAALVAACSSDETKEQRRQYEFDNSISNPQNNSSISEVNARYLSDAETRSIWEIFTGQKFGHGRLFLQSQPGEREGLYFFVMFETYLSNVLEGTKISLFVHLKGSARVNEYHFKVDSTSNLLRELALGITGKDFDALAKDAAEKSGKTRAEFLRKPYTRLLAWKVVLSSPDGKVISQKQSWLWSADREEN